MKKKAMETPEFNQMCYEIYEAVKSVSPIKTGNLRNNAITIEFADGGDTCIISVNEDIAPYMPYTNEVWLSPRFNGKQNPNKNWWNKTAYEKIIQTINSCLRDRVIREDKND